MARCLYHRPDYRIDRWIHSEAGVAVGRVGPSHVNLIVWPATSAARPGTVRAFFSGIGHGKNGAPGLTEIPDSTSLTQLTGFYAALFHCTNPQHTVLVADRRASSPFFYTETHDFLLFVPEVKALLACPEVRTEIDTSGLATFVIAGHLLGGQTLFRSVRRLRGGEYLRVEGGI